MSIVGSLIGIVQALLAVSTLVGDGNWNGGTAIQQQLLTILPSITRNLGRIPECQGFASYNARNLNEKLAKANSSVRLRPWHNDGTHVGAVSICTLAASWRVQGQVTESDGRPAFRVQTEHGLEFRDMPNSPEPVVTMKATNGDIYAFWHTEMRDTNIFALRDAAHAMQHAPPHVGQLVTAIIPMISLERDADITWIIGMHLGNNSIAQALQRVSFKVNERGAQTDVVTATATIRGVRSFLTIYTLKPPFIASITRPNVDESLFVAYIDADALGNTGSGK